MKPLNEKLNALRDELQGRSVRVLILGLGSVGNYLLNYLLSTQDDRMEIFVAGRDENKLRQDVNIARISALIRGQYRSTVSILGGVDFNHTDEIARALEQCRPDIIINSSRAYSGLKYGSLSWKSIRAYGLWAPLAIRYVKNIMDACERTCSDAIVINTSYSDAVIPWMRSAGKAYPDFGSGNINHLIPRLRLAAAEQMGIPDPWNLDITFAVSHFHDVVISKEGQTEGVDMLLDIRYQGQPVSLDMGKLISQCAIDMPTDARRNQMNASSNFEIIRSVLSAVRDNAREKLHCPGVFGEIGGYPVILDGTGEAVRAYIDESRFPLELMRAKNRESIYLDGIRDVQAGTLFYTDELLEKVRIAFGVELFSSVSFDQIDRAADFIIQKIIEKNI